MREQLKQGFSLMEMMVVLLIVAIIAAATAPMVTKKMSRNAGTGDSPWVFTGLNNSIAYNMNGSDASAIIGTSRYNRGNNGPQYPRLVLASGNDGQHPAFAFADANGNFSGQINMNQASGIVTLNNAAVGNNSTAIGMGQTIDGSPSGIVAIGQGLGVASISTDAIAIGKGVEVNGLNAIAIGNNESDEDEGKTYARGESAIAIGHNAQANSATSIAIGKHAEADLDCIAVGQDSGASGSYSIALGRNTFATGARSVAIGGCHNTNHNKAAGASGASSVAIGISSRASHEKSVAIGYEAETTTSNQIVLGSSDATVYIPGNLVVGGNAYIGSRITPSSVGRAYGTPLYLKLPNGCMKLIRDEYPNSNHLRLNDNLGRNDVTLDKAYTSDRRLKNVGEKYTAGLAELKKLDFFHYTFKKDSEKTPHVGVMAQDLEKVFPDAVTKGEDGYLRIRFEDMFYAVINAVKELDNKITEIVENITGMQKTVDAQQEIIEELQKQNKEILKQNEELQKRIEKLEKNK